MIDFEELLQLMVKKKASDLFITVGIAPSLKINGKIVRVDEEVFSPQLAKETVFGLMTEEQQKIFLQTQEANFAISAKNIGRFRASAFFQRNHPGMVIRRINTVIPTIEEINLPDIAKSLIMNKRGLIIIVGATGSGKSTSMAAMIGYRNKMESGHIISIEDPIEFLHAHDKCIITQREVGLDTDSFSIALKNSMRQAPDVIQIGEIRSSDTMAHAMVFSETGHLCLATLHANNANQALERIITFFPEAQREQVWMDLSLNLKAILAQRLLPSKDGSGQVMAMEVMLNTPVIASHIRRKDVNSLKELMERGEESGMMTFDKVLLGLYATEKISYEVALANADSENNLRLMINFFEENRRNQSE